MKRAEQLRASYHDVLYVLAGIGTKCHALQGPRGALGVGVICARSQFYRFERDSRTGWQWVAFDAAGKVLHVIEYPDSLPPFYDTPSGALWALRECVADHFHNVRSHKGH